MLSSVYLEEMRKMSVELKEFMQNPKFMPGSLSIHSLYSLYKMGYKVDEIKYTQKESSLSSRVTNQRKSENDFNAIVRKIDIRFFIENIQDLRINVSSLGMAKILNSFFARIDLLADTLLRSINHPHDILLGKIATLIQETGDLYRIIIEMLDTSIELLSTDKTSDLEEIFDIIIMGEFSVELFIKTIAAIERIYYYMGLYCGIDTKPLEIIKIESGSFEFKSKGEKKLILLLKELFRNSFAAVTGKLALDNNVDSLRKITELVMIQQECIDQKRNIDAHVAEAQENINVVLKNITAKLAEITSIPNKGVIVNGELISVEQSNTSKKQTILLGKNNPKLLG